MRTFTNAQSAALRRYRGVALVLVLAVIGIAALMGAAVLATASLQAQSRGNTASATQSQYLAESGANLAILYLQYPAKAPALQNGYYNGQSGISFGSTVSGTVDVSVDKLATDLYEITSTGWAGSDPLNRFKRRLKVVVHAASEFQVNQATAVAGDITLPAGMTVTGNLLSDGVVTRTAGATVTGSVLAIGSNVSDWIAKPIFPTCAAPKYSQINIVSTIASATPYYEYTDASGVTQRGYPEALPGSVSGTLTAGPTNPKNVWYADSNVTLGDCTINGTVVMLDSKKVNINGTANIAAQDGMPALVAGAVRFQSGITPKNLTVDGLCWAGEITTTTDASPATNSTMTVNGALLMGDDTPRIDANVVGTIAVTYVKAKVQVPTFSDVNRTPVSVKVVRWGEQ